MRCWGQDWHFGVGLNRDSQVQAMLSPQEAMMIHGITQNAAIPREVEIEHS
jgi:hypothetical protein